MKVADAISAIARCRSSGANSTGITESDSGKIAAAPIPSTARPAISSPAAVAGGHTRRRAPATRPPPPRDQLAGAGRVRAHHRTGPEQDERGQQHLLAPEPVAKHARG